MSLPCPRHTSSHSAAQDAVTNPSRLTGLHSKIGLVRRDTTLPTGTVASRVSYLHSLGSSASNTTPSEWRPHSPSGRAHSSESRHHREGTGDSRGGFGRRAAARFGYPAQRNGIPSEEASGAAGHSFLGLHEGKLKDLEDTAENEVFREKVKKSSRSIGHGNQSEKVSPEPKEPKDMVIMSTSVQRRAREYSQHIRDAILSSASVPNPAEGRATATPSAAPSVLGHTTHRGNTLALSSHSSQTIDEWIEKATSGPLASEDSTGQSGVTTSTGRIRSAQHLYSFYGIEEPNGLFSRQKIAFNAPLLPILVTARKCCHICLSINGCVERCFSCGHRLCSECKEIGHATAPVAKSEAGYEFDIFEDPNDAEEVDMEMKDLRTTGNVYTPSEWEQENRVEKSRMTSPAYAISSRQSPRANGSPATLLSPLLNPLPATPVGIPHIVTVPSPLRSASTLTTVPLSGNHSTIKDSPFIIADKQSSVRRFVSKIKRVAELHHNPQAVQNNSDHSHLHFQNQNNEDIREQSDPVSKGCESSACRANHTGHHPNRHSISCTWKKSEGKAGGRVPTPHLFVPSKAREMADLMPKPLTPSKSTRKRKNELRDGDHVPPTAKIHPQTPTPQRNCEDEPYGYPLPNPEQHTRHEHMRYEPSPYSQALQIAHGHPFCHAHEHRDFRNSSHRSTLIQHEQAPCLVPANPIQASQLCLARSRSPVGMRASAHPSASYHSFSQNLSARSHQFSQSSEYVECHGYPRTGHVYSNNRAGSPVISGILGECQHCIDDCTCKSCQNVSHSVRCCMNAVHPTVVHKHPHPLHFSPPEHHYPTPKQETETVSSAPEVRSPTPKTVRESPKWMSLLVAEESKDKIGKEVAGSGIVELGKVAGTNAQQRTIQARTMAVIRAVSPYVLATDGHVGTRDVRQVLIVHPEGQAMAMNERVVERAKTGEKGVQSEDLANDMSDEPSKVHEDLEKREKRSDTPSPESIALRRESTDAPAVTSREQLSETGTEIHTPMVNMPPRSDTYGISRKSSTPRAVPKSATKPAPEGIEKIDGISIVIHLQGGEDLILEVDVVGVVRKG